MPQVIELAKRELEEILSQLNIDKTNEDILRDINL